MKETKTGEWVPDLSQCTANKPLWMVIPPEGVTIQCPVHPNGHFIKGPKPDRW